MSAGQSDATDQIPALDGWRGLAISLLLVGHFMPLPGINLGTAGVNLFFVLSGLLMARLLFVKRVPLGEFYRRRISRIVPAHLCFIALVVLGFIAAGLPVSGSETVSAALFANNYFVGKLDQNLMPFGHLWSLAVEEHSYVLLSVVALGTRFFQRAALPWLTLLCIASALVGIVYWTQYEGRTLDFRKWPHTEVSAYGILVSASLCVWFQRRGAPSTGVLLVPALIALGLALHWWSVPAPLRQTVGIGAFALAVNLLPTSTAIIQRAFALRWLRHLGFWSFSLYLWQQPFYLASRQGSMPMLAGIGCTFIFGLGSYYLIEGPARKYLNSHWREVRRRSPGAPIS